MFECVVENKLTICALNIQHLYWSPANIWIGPPVQTLQISYQLRLMYGKNERKCEVWHSPFPSQTKTHLTNDSGLIIIHSLLKHINPYYLSAALFSIPFASFSSISAMQLEWPTHTIMQKKSSEIVSYCFIRAFFCPALLHHLRTCFWGPVGWQK